MFDLLINGGDVLDGTGAPAWRADVAIAGERIAALGDLTNAEARTTINAAGRIVCPGFIDVHSHSDTFILLEPTAPSKIFQGVTTEIVGNCGASTAPRQGVYQLPSDWREKNYPGTWSSVAEYRALLAHVQPAVNIALLIGHNSLRAGVIGYDARTATADEVRAMCALLDRALAEGGAGLSTGLIYTPGLYSAPEEVRALTAVAARHGKMYTSHMRSEGDQLLAALDETLDLGRTTGARVEVSHLKTSGRRNWKKLDAALEKIRTAQAAGICVAADRYPYTASCTDLDVILPDWAAGDGRDAVLARLRDPTTRQRLRNELQRDTDWATIMVGSITRADLAQFRGQRIPEIADALGVEPVEAALHLLDVDELRPSGIFFGMSEENMWRILAEPWVMIGSDASIRALTGPLAVDFPHPRAFGTFPRLLRAALDGQTVPLPEMIRKMTSLPADHFQLKGRGRLAAGAFADVVVFDPQTVRDRTTFAAPRHYAEGIESVIVNGRLTMQSGQFTGSRGGCFLD
ncbi:MAG: D-aminoacylase [Verrucomicrobia bacterium]|nr:MAG: D-aminoacylase [Verrucomicrobiota bacterium]